MSKGLRIFLVIAILWLALWTMGGVLFLRASSTHALEAEHVAQPLTTLSRGQALRIEGAVEPSAGVDAPLSGTRCVAAILRIHRVSHYRDSQDKTQRDARLVSARRWGPSRIGIRTGDGRVELPLEAWTPSGSPSASETMNELPERFLVGEREVEAARSAARGTFAHYAVDEVRLAADDPVFVVARVKDAEGELELEPDPVLGRIEVFRGSQAELVADLRGSSAGLRIAGWIFFVLAGGPLVVFFALFFRARKKARQSGPLPSASPSTSPGGPSGTSSPVMSSPTDSSKQSDTSP